MQSEPHGDYLSWDPELAMTIIQNGTAHESIRHWMTCTATAQSVEKWFADNWWVPLVIGLVVIISVVAIVFYLRCHKGATAEGAEGKTRVWFHKSKGDKKETTEDKEEKAALKKGGKKGGKKPKKEEAKSKKGSEKKNEAKKGKKEKAKAKKGSEKRRQQKEGRRVKAKRALRSDPLGLRKGTYKIL